MVGVGSPELAAPWYRIRPRAALVVATALFVGVAALEGLDTRASDALALMYMLPIALVAVTFGFRSGLAAALACYGAFSVFALTDSTGYLGLDGWVTRAAAMFLLGGLLGRASDRQVRAAQLALEHQRDRLLIEAKNRRYAEGIEISDSILQHVTAAKWMLEQGRYDDVARLLSTALERGQRMVGELLPGQVATPAPEMEAQKPL